MGYHDFTDILSGSDKSAAARVLRPVLKAISIPYGGLMRLRRWAYHRGLKRSYQADIPVICVGNITTGGTGKTPMAAMVVELLKSAGMNPAVLTRGYKSVDERSDEAMLLGEICGVMVIVSPDRVKGAAEAARRGADVVVMDDGFQHMRLRRDMNIVLIDATNPFGYGRCLPAGLLREPLSALKDADICVITRSELVNTQELDAIVERLGMAFSFEVFTASHKPTGWIAPDGSGKPLDAIKNGAKTFAFCGLGNPKAFFSTLKNMGVEPVGVCPLADHVHYTTELAYKLNKQADQCGADIFTTTQKDFTKINPELFTRPVWQLAVKIQIDDAESFNDLVIENVAKRRHSS